MECEMNREWDDVMYELYLMAIFLVEGANLFTPHRENSNFNCVISWFSSFFKGFIGAGGMAQDGQKVNVNASVPQAGQFFL